MAIYELLSPLFRVICGLEWQRPPTRPTEEEGEDLLRRRRRRQRGASFISVGSCENDRGNSLKIVAQSVTEEGTIREGYSQWIGGGGTPKASQKD